MVDFMFPEARALHFHRVALGQALQTPNLLRRARDILPRLRAARPNLADAWDRWAVALDLPPDRMAEDVLADTPTGGLLRAHSPLYECLTETERMALWQRVGLQQFVAYFQVAAEDLAWDDERQAAITGIDPKVLAAWRRELPITILASVMAVLKSVVSIHRALVGFTETPEARRAWLAEPNPNLGGRPIDLMGGGRLSEVEAYLVDAARDRLTRGDVPSA